MTSSESRAIVRRALDLGSFLVVCGLLLQLGDWGGWLVVVPVFVLFYSKAPVYSETLPTPRFSGQGQSSKAKVPAIVASRSRAAIPRLRNAWCRKAYARSGEIWTSVLLVCLPFMVELAIEDFLFERLLGV